MSKIRAAIVGLGGMGFRVHAKHYSEDERVELVAFCDIRIERAEKARDTYALNAKVYEDYLELVKDPDIDVVNIATPNYMHAPIAIAALKAGKHVFCEKPDSITVENVLAMKAAAEESGKVLMVMRNNRFVEASSFAKQFIEDGRMGEIYAGRCGWQRRRGIPGKGGWFTTKEESGGGPLIDLGVHMIDLAIWLMGNPTPVAVSGNTFRYFANSNTSDSVHSKFGDAKNAGTFDVEDLAMGMIRFDNGAMLQIEFSWASNIKQENRFVELRGSKAGLTWKDEELELYTEDLGKLVDIAPRFKPVSGHGMNLKHFIDVLEKGVEPCFKPQQGVDMVKILSAIYESAETGREVIL